MVNGLGENGLASSAIPEKPGKASASLEVFKSASGTAGERVGRNLLSVNMDVEQLRETLPR